MNIPDMIEVLQAAERGEKIESRNVLTGKWNEFDGMCWDFSGYDYRIAPKPQMTLVERLRCSRIEDCIEAADRIEFLEQGALNYYPTDELLAEVRRRLLK